MKTNYEQIIVIPTYNAKAGVIKVISQVLKKAPKAKVTVVDDNSPDKTGELVKDKFSLNSRVNVIIRKNKGGRGSAVVEGFKRGLKNKKINLFIEMDSDLVHDPNDLPRLIDKSKKYDVVVASRYLLKSQIIKWSIKRKVLSRLANLWIKLMLGISLSDNTSGFRCYKRNVLENINFDSISSKGFIVLTEIAYQIYKKGFRFGEIPINFKPVDINRSNLNIKELKEAFSAVLRLKMKSLLLKLI
ncbi:MAG: glycosyltransferase [Patescibacteria group bacterium]